jgi:hypothetical protein
VRSGALRGLIPAHRFVQKVWVDLGLEHGIGQIERPNILAF